MISSLSDHLGRFNMLHIQSSTLAGGISMGTVANVILYPHHAVLVGALAGLLSVVGHVLITPRFLEKRLSLYDTCGVHNLHGLPGLLAGVFSVFFVLYYKPSEYGQSIHQIYPYFEGGELHHGDRDQYTQAFYQFTGIVITLVMAVVGGLISGAGHHYYLHAEFSLFGKLENGIVNEEFQTGTRTIENGGNKVLEEKTRQLVVRARVNPAEALRSESYCSTMSTIAVARLAEERKSWRKDHPHGFVAKVCKNPDGTLDLFRWKCGIPGFKDTDWEGGLFTLIITFTVEYPSAPPHCRFEPAIFHPNIFDSGTVCLSLLKQEKHWKPSISIRQILLGIQELLHNPNVKDPANKKANNLFKSNKTKYSEEIKSQAKKYSEEIVMKELLGIE
uniref:SUMO-conjugating enzyme UBC9 n=1 Tax=Ditylenchus dipsaci TaxID=166011 RepID=A0A915DH55_9BILA